MSIIEGLGGDWNEIIYIFLLLFVMIGYYF